MHYLCPCPDCSKFVCKGGESFVKEHEEKLAELKKYAESLMWAGSPETASLTDMERDGIGYAIVCILERVK